MGAEEDETLAEEEEEEGRFGLGLGSEEMEEDGVEDNKQEHQEAHENYGDKEVP